VTPAIFKLALKYSLNAATVKYSKELPFVMKTKFCDTYRYFCLKNSTVEVCMYLCVYILLDDLRDQSGFSVICVKLGSFLSRSKYRVAYIALHMPMTNLI